MKHAPQARIVDITGADEFKEYLCRCITGPPSKACRSRMEYLEEAIPRGFHKKLLIVDKRVVGQIEYSPAEASYYPITGDDVIIMNCIWVFRKAKGQDFGRRLLENMIESEREASSFATIALEDHWTQWFRKDQILKLGFKPLDSVRVIHRAKNKPAFLIHLMWIPNAKKAEAPSWNRQKMLEGITSCTAHPLYRQQNYRPKQILQTVGHQALGS